MIYNTFCLDVNQLVDWMLKNPMTYCLCRPQLYIKPNRNWRQSIRPRNTPHLLRRSSSSPIESLPAMLLLLLSHGVQVCFSVCMLVCQSICMLVCLSIWLLVHHCLTLSVCLPVGVSVVSVGLSLSHSQYLLVGLSICPLVCHSDSVSACWCVHLLWCLYMFFFFFFWWATVCWLALYRC